MKRALTVFGPALLLAACGDDGGGTGSNPAQLWLVNDGVETEVKLIDHEPPPF